MKVECHVQVSVVEVPKVKQEDVQLQYPNENMLLLQDSPAPRHVENSLVESLMNDEKVKWQLSSFFMDVLVPYFIFLFQKAVLSAFDAFVEEEPLNIFIFDSLKFYL